MLLVLLMHLPYVFFITVGRYNLTAMPFLMVFGAWGLRRLRHLGNWSSEKNGCFGISISVNLSLLCHLRSGRSDSYSDQCIR